MNSKKILFYKFIIVLLFPLLVSGQTEDSDSANPKILALTEELGMENVKIKLMGSGNDLMLEGEVSNQELSKFAEEVSKQYFSNVFNIITVTKQLFSYQFFSAEYKNFEASSVGSRYVDVLKQGFSIETPWHFLLFDDKEMENFKKDLTEFFNAEFVDTSVEKTDAPFTASVLFRGNVKYKACLNAVSMDNGYLDCSVQIISTGTENKENVVFQKNLFCRKGEWIVLTGFSKITKGVSTIDSTPETEKNDIIFIFKPEFK